MRPTHCLEEQWFFILTLASNAAYVRRETVGVDQYRAAGPASKLCRSAKHHLVEVSQSSGTRSRYGERVEDCNIRISPAIHSRLSVLAAEAEVSIDQFACSLLAEHLGNADPSVALESEIMSVDQAADFLGVGRNSVYDATGAHKIPHNRVGRRLLFSRSALIEWAGEIYKWK